MFSYTLVLRYAIIYAFVSTIFNEADLYSTYLALMGKGGGRGRYLIPPLLFSFSF